MKSITRIVITGGPCAGKTTAFGRIEQELTKNAVYSLVLASVGILIYV